MLSTMPDFALTVQGILRHGRAVYADSRVVALSETGIRHASFAEVAEEAERLAVGLHRLGLEASDCVGSYCVNHIEHLAAYFAVPSSGAVLHTLNIRLAPEQLAYVIGHAEDRILLVDTALAPMIAEIADRLPSVEHCILVGDGEITGLPGEVHRYADVLAEPGAIMDWPELDDSSAASLCYTSGTTGNPRGVAYSHRSTYVHALAQCAANAFALAEADTVAMIVPMFHANAWGLPYSCWLTGADMILPGAQLQAEPLSHLFATYRPTFTAAVPTIYNDLLRYGETHPLELSSLRMALCGGSPVTATLIDQMRERHGVSIVQGWGMTETSPLAALARPPKGSPPEEDTRWRTKSGRPMAGIEMRLVDSMGSVLPWDGTTVGEIEVRGPWVTSSYFREDTPEKFSPDGWLRTGDIGYGDQKGYVQLTDRTKDVIKTGGEWISSVELENVLMGHPDVLEAAVIAVPDPRWDERPLACVVLREGSDVDAAALRAWLDGRVARFWLPERWAFIAEVPKTSVGKFDKKSLRARYADDALQVSTVSRDGVTTVS